MKRMLCLVLAAMLACSASAENKVYIQNPLWSHQIPGKINTLKAGNGTILVGAENGAYMLDYSKSQLWFHPTGGPVTAIHTMDDGRILVTSSDGPLVLLNRSGGYVWDRPVPGYVGYDAAVDADQRGILCGSMDGYVYMFDLNGTFDWKHLVGSYVTNARMLEDRIIAVSDRQVYIMDLDGKVRRNLDIAGYIRAADLTADLIAVGLDDDRLYVFDGSGGPMWDHTLNESITAIDAGGNITVGTRQKHIWQFAPNGTLLWRLNMTDGVAAVKQSQGNVLASTLDGKVRLYDGAGTMKWYYDTDGRATELDMFDNNVVSGTTTGEVYYSKLPKRDTKTSLLVSAMVMAIVAASIILISRSWR